MGTKKPVKHVEEVERETMPCYVCGNYGTNMQPLGMGVYRHDECMPGSQRWKEYVAIRQGKRSDVTTILLGKVALGFALTFLLGASLVSPDEACAEVCETYQTVMNGRVVTCMRCCDPDTGFCHQSCY